MSKPSNRGEQLLALRKLIVPTVVPDGATIAGATMKSVLRTIDDHCNPTCWASVATIASETCLSEKTVRRSIKTLKSIGLIFVDEKIGQTSTIKMNWQAITTPVTVTEVVTDSTPVTVSTTPVIVSTHPGNCYRLNEKKRDRNEKKRESAPAHKFSSPSLIEVQSLWKAKSLKGNPEGFFYHYEANGWTQGRQSKPLKSWQAAAHKWSTNEKDFESKPTFSGKAKTVNLSSGVNYDPNRSTANVKF